MVAKENLQIYFEVETKIIAQNIYQPKNKKKQWMVAMD